MLGWIFYGHCEYLQVGYICLFCLEWDKISDDEVSQGKWEPGRVVSDFV